ncbi:nitrogen fixation protein NifU [Methylocapsa polymorpha]|uniref:Nitrogen fixation protein NifU n=1 Tax=Methylocapsa polymorpha TaxID=3080828 RepID=A0ABZ0HWX5_9HYPH|nr:nitrogen fixation protein NifU [Methylocapsa sp. RX1]
MSNGGDKDGGAMQNGLRRLEALIEAIDGLRDSTAREAARELLELMLDLHGLALARIVSIVASASDGTALTERLASDANVKAIMLLHGLHPEEPEMRLRKTLASMRPHWGVRGVRVELIHVGAGAARVRVYRSECSGAASDSDLRREIEEALVEAAPDLDDIIIEGLNEARDAEITAVAV